MRKSIFQILFALLLSPFSCALAADPKPSLDSVGDFDKTLPPKNIFSPKVLETTLAVPPKSVEWHIQKHQYGASSKP